MTGSLPATWNTRRCCAFPGLVARPRLDRPGAWARRVALNLIADRHRRATTERRTWLRSSGPDDVSALDPAFDVEFWSAVAALPERQRVAVALYYVLDRSVDEVAASMDVHPGTVKRMLHQAWAALRQPLEVFGYDGEVDHGR